MADFYISSSNLIKNFVNVCILLACSGGASDEVFSTSSSSSATVKKEPGLSGEAEEASAQADVSPNWLP